MIQLSEHDVTRRIVTALRQRAERLHGMADDPRMGETRRAFREEANACSRLASEIYRLADGGPLALASPHGMPPTACYQEEL